MIYFNKLSDEKAAASTVRGANSAIAHHFRHSATHPTASPLVKSARKASGKLAPAPKQRAPLSREHLRALATWCEGNWQGDKRLLRDITLILIAWRGFLRGDEVVSLTGKDVTLVVYTQDVLEEHTELKPPKEGYRGLTRVRRTQAIPRELFGKAILHVFISSDKTNPQKQKPKADRAGKMILIGPDTDEVLCPVRWFRRWKAVRTSIMFEETPLFHSLDVKTANAKGKDESQVALSKGTVNHIVKNRLKEVGIDANALNIGGHSLRAGGATDAAQRGVDLSLLKKHGRWKSDAVFLYLRDDVGDELEFNVTAGGLAASVPAEDADDSAAVPQPRSYQGATKELPSSSTARAGNANGTGTGCA